MSDFGADDFGGDNDMLDNLGSGNDARAGVQQNDNDNIRLTSVTDNILGANAFGNQQNQDAFGYGDTGFDYAGDDTNHGQNPTGVFSQAANALGGNVGFGDAMGLESGGNVDEMMGLDMGLEGDEEAKDSKIKIRVFINFDEDDDNKYNIDLNDLFKRVDKTLPYYVDVQISDHYNCQELIVDTLDLFNKRLTDPAVGAQYTLNDDIDKLDDNFSLYIAKKKGGPKDDFPGFSLLSIVKGTGYERFALCCFSSAFVKQGSNNINTVTSLGASAPENKEMEQVNFGQTQRSSEEKNESIKQAKKVQDIQQQTGKVEEQQMLSVRRIDGKNKDDISKENMLPADQKGCCKCQIF